MLTEEERGKLLYDLLKFGATGEIATYSEEERVLTILFSNYSQTMQRDAERYEKQCQSNSQKAKKRWAKIKGEKHVDDSEEYFDEAEREPPHATACNGIQPHTDIEIDTDIDIVNSNSYRDRQSYSYSNRLDTEKEKDKEKEDTVIGKEKDIGKGVKGENLAFQEGTRQEPRELIKESANNFSYQNQDNYKLTNISDKMRICDYWNNLNNTDPIRVLYDERLKRTEEAIKSVGGIEEFLRTLKGMDTEVLEPYKINKGKANYDLMIQDFKTIKTTIDR